MRTLSRILNEQTLENIGHVFASVRGCLEVFIDFPPFEQRNDVLRILEELPQCEFLDGVCPVLQRMYFQEIVLQGREFLGMPQVWNGLVDLPAAQLDHMRKFDRVLRWFRNLEKQQPCSRIFHLIENVIQRFGQSKNVFAVQWSHKSAVQHLDCFMRQGITAIFIFGDFVDLSGYIRIVLHQIMQRDAAIQNIAGRLIEDVEEDRLSRNKAELEHSEIRLQPYRSRHEIYVNERQKRVMIICYQGLFYQGNEMKILVLCTGNSARSQMAEGLLRHHGGRQVSVHSAGTRPKGLNPLAVQVMSEIGIDISHQSSKNVSDFAGHKFDWVITVCDQAKEECPVFPGSRMLHWTTQDPEDLGEFRSARDALNSRIKDFLSITETAERKKPV